MCNLSLLLIFVCDNCRFAENSVFFCFLNCFSFSLCGKCFLFLISYQIFKENEMFFQIKTKVVKTELINYKN